MRFALSIIEWWEERFGTSGLDEVLRGAKRSALAVAKTMSRCTGVFVYQVLWPGKVPVASAYVKETVFAPALSESLAL